MTSSSRASREPGAVCFPHMGEASPENGTAYLGRYRLLHRIARGGMAEVWAARVRGEGTFLKLVAVKRMHAHLAEDERFVRMFLDEAQLAVYVASPHVVETLDLGRSEEGSLYLVMDLVRGVPLHRLLGEVAKNRHVVPIEVAVDILAQAARGLDDAHKATTPTGDPLHLVHRDVSPQNILVGRDGRVRITDFGIAHAVRRRTETTVGELKGKLSYFAPEQVGGKVDARTDVFGLGVVAWETFAARRLFRAKNAVELLDLVREMPIPPLNEIRPDVPPELAAVVARALERAPDDRWPSAAEFAEALWKAIGQDFPPLSSPAVVSFLETYGGEELRSLEGGIQRALAMTKHALDISQLPSGDHPASSIPPPTDAAAHLPQQAEGSHPTVAARKPPTPQRPHAGKPTGTEPTEVQQATDEIPGDPTVVQRPTRDDDEEETGSKSQRPTRPPAVRKEALEAKTKVRESPIVERRMPSPLPPEPLPLDGEPTQIGVPLDLTLPEDDEVDTTAVDGQTAPFGQEGVPPSPFGAPPRAPVPNVETASSNGSAQAGSSSPGAPHAGQPHAGQPHAGQPPHSPPPSGQPQSLRPQGPSSARDPFSMPTESYTSPTEDRGPSPATLVAYGAGIALGIAALAELVWALTR